MENLKSSSLAALLALSTACSPDPGSAENKRNPKQTDTAVTGWIDQTGTDPETLDTGTIDDSQTDTGTPPTNTYNDTQLLFHKIITNLIGDQPGQGIDGTSCPVFFYNGQPEREECLLPADDGKQLVLDGFTDLVSEHIGNQLTFDQVSHLEGTGPMVVLFNQTENAQVIYITPATDDLDQELQNIDWDLGNPGLSGDTKYLEVQNQEHGFHHGIAEGELINSHQTMYHWPEFTDYYGNTREEKVEIMSSSNYYGFEVSDRPDLDISPIDAGLTELHAGYTDSVRLMLKADAGRLSIQKGDLSGDEKTTQGMWVYFSGY